MVNTAGNSKIVHFFCRGIYIDFNVFFSIVIRILSIGSGNNLLDLDDLIMHYR